MATLITNFLIEILEIKFSPNLFGSRHFRMRNIALLIIDIGERILS